MNTMTRAQRKAHDVLHDTDGKDKGLTIRCNNVRRFTIDAYELTTKERKEFDYLDWPAIEAGNDGATFFRYLGQLYDLGEFTRCEHAFGMAEWDGYFAHCMSSGVLVKYVDNGEAVIVGMYFS
jgi:hypothetical protein